ncbi:MAG: serine hydrolase [Pandoraea sp.]|nr:serine hydrolase [Pandoraea sp.]MDR3397177.1 serine hydrolase [Pandoraea sp.]
MTTFQPTRRQALKIAATSLAAPALLSTAPQVLAAGVADVDAAVRRFGALAPQTSSCLIEAGGANGQTWRAAYAPDTQLFVGSAVKTFILAQFLRDAETGRAGLNTLKPCTVDDSVRSPGSPVLVGLTGTTPYRTALEAMISHSDNTGTDIALAAVGPDRVRALIAEAGLHATRIPDSTRKLFSYLAGAESGVDLGWAGMVKLGNNENLGLKPRTDVINDKQAMLSTASEMVRWYQQSLAGRFFSQPASLTEYKRIQATADALWMAVPDGLLSFGKGGSLDWESYHCLCFAGQMRVRTTPVTFCFTLNWTGGKLSTERTGEFIAAASDALKAAAAAVPA